VLGVTVAAAAACGGGTTPSPAQPGQLGVVATTTVFADLVAEVGGANVAVTSLVPKGGEVHTFDPSPSDVTALGDADLIVMNGLGLDDWLADLAAGAGVSAPLIRLAEDLQGVEYLAGEEDDEPVNPHLWLDVANGIRYAERIGAGLADADPTRAASYEAGTAAYVARLVELDGWVRAQIGAIPEADRRIVSFHEAFPYFARAYGLVIVGVVVEAPGKDPSAADIAALVDAIRASGARAVFSEAQFSPDLAAAIAEDAGVAVESDLYNDSLGDPPVDTYEGLIRWDVERIVEALR
jgi:zinc/manganese transport system substrate-binding protein/manganese/iron transport system substrate-binding protein